MPHFPTSYIENYWNSLFTSTEAGINAKYPRPYPHFDPPLKHKRATALVTNPDKVSSHSFLPFLFYNKKVRRYRGKKNRKRTKIRPIMYASHKDSCIFAYYTIMLSEMYEKKIAELELGDVVTAYRKDIGNNIKFAKTAFHEIASRGNCAAIALDISNFFDNIDHHNLKVEWCNLLGGDRLPKDHYAVFKAISKWDKVDRDACYNLLGINKNDVPKPICAPQEFRDKIRKNGLITSNERPYGIPQGSPISAFLANLYMLPFDLEMQKLALEFGGYYRRYSDDILWICDAEDTHTILELVDKALEDRGDQLKRSQEKTELSIFYTNKHGQQRSYALNNCGEKNHQKPFQYLGFTFDGKTTLLRSQTLAKFHRRLIYSVWGAKRAAKRRGSSQIFRRKLNRELTHLGKRNFVTGYATNSSKEMRDNSIKKQLTRNYERVTKELKRKTRKRKN
jgi:hypothetical protein